MNNVVLYCRPGFEKECATEITEQAAMYKVNGIAHEQRRSGYVVFVCDVAGDADKLLHQLSFRALVFARQMFLAGELLQLASETDRISPLLARLKSSVHCADELRVEVPDTNEGKNRLKFCRKFTVPLRKAMRQQGMLSTENNRTHKVVHVFFTTSTHCYVGYSIVGNHSPFYMGIPRLKLPMDAPSRSTLKLEEAWHVFIPADEWDERLVGGMRAVDLGASPGGWTYQLVKRQMLVQAVDNGEMDRRLMESGQVSHYRVDGFKFVPNKHITWLVCDMVEKPAKVTQLIADWLIKGWCREAIFNLKLPMKQRYAEVRKNIQLLQTLLQQQAINAEIHAKQLFHDREEVTVHVRRVWGSLSHKKKVKYK